MFFTAQLIFYISRGYVAMCVGDFNLVVVVVRCGGPVVYGYEMFFIELLTFLANWLNVFVLQFIKDLVVMAR